MNSIRLYLLLNMGQILIIGLIISLLIILNHVRRERELEAMKRSLLEAMIVGVCLFVGASVICVGFYYQTIGAINGLPF